MTLPPERMPVIAGIGELCARPSPDENGRSPLALLCEAAQRAGGDAGGGMLERIDSVDVVRTLSWPYRDLAHALAQKLALPAGHLANSPLGGDQPTTLLSAAAARIADGEHRVALIAGSEALYSVTQAARAGRRPDWTDAETGTPESPESRIRAIVHEEALRYAPMLPVQVYPLYENACRTAWGQSLAEGQAESGRLLAAMAAVASANPHAWAHDRLSAQAAVTSSQNNRPIAFPYTRLQVARFAVDQAAAVLLCSLAEARAAGIPEQRLVHVGSAAAAHEPRDFLQRSRYDQAPAMTRTLLGALEANSMSPADIDLHELYSCFPIVPKLARRALGLADGHPCTVTGGLPCFGGPGNNYMTHAVTAMTRALRRGDGRTGLLYGNGEYLTKHHAVVLSSQPLPTGPVQASLQAQVDAFYGAVPPLHFSWRGPCRLETWTVCHDGRGAVEYGLAVLRSPGGGRLLARVPAGDEATIRHLLDAPDVSGAVNGLAYDGENGLAYWRILQ